MWTALSSQPLDQNCLEFVKRKMIPRKSDIFGENGKACALSHGLNERFTFQFFHVGEVILSATRKGHDVFGLVATQSLLESTTSMLDVEDETQLFSDSEPCTSKRGLDDHAEPSPSPKRKHCTTRSNGKQLPSWSKTINPQNQLRRCTIWRLTDCYIS